MKTSCLSLITVSILLGFTSLHSSADPETITPQSKTIHRVSHRSDSVIRTTKPVSTETQVAIVGHDEDQKADGKYIWVPAHTAAAPTPDSYWIAPGCVAGHTGYFTGHWSTDVLTDK